VDTAVAAQLRIAVEGDEYLAFKQELAVRMGEAEIFLKMGKA
jgi:hypothetical protein